MISPSSVQLFSRLQHDEIKAIEAAAIQREFEASETIVRANESAKSLFLIQTGCVDYYVTTEAGEYVLLRRLAAGDVFGVSCFLSKPIGYLGTAKAAQHVQALEWTHLVARRLANSYPQLVENSLRIVLRYLALYAKRHIGLVSNTAQERLACALSNLGSRIGHAVPSGVEVGVKNEDLASLADVSSFTTSRILKAWARDGMVEKSRGKIIVLSPEKLLAV